MAWLQTSHSFQQRVKILTLTHYDVVNADIEAIEELLHRCERHAETLELLLHKLVIKARPELSGCTIWFMDFRAGRRMWEVGVCHESFAYVAMGSEIPREPLYQEERSAQSS